MKTNKRRSTFGWTSILVMTLLTIMVGSVYAQEKDKKSDDVYRVEIKDGKLFVDGEMIKEFKDKTKGFAFSSDDDDSSNRFVFFTDDDEGHTGRVLRKFKKGAPRVWKMDFDSDVDYPVMGSFSLHSDDDENEMMFGDGEHRVEIVASEFEGPLRERMDMLRGRAREYGMSSSKSKKIGKMEREARELAKEIRGADDANKAELESKLDKLLTDIFDLKMEEQQKRVDKMTKELEKLRSRISERQTSKTDIIERRRNKLLGVRDVMEW